MKKSHKLNSMFPIVVSITAFSLFCSSVPVINTPIKNGYKGCKHPQEMEETTLTLVIVLSGNVIKFKMKEQHPPI